MHQRHVQKMKTCLPGSFQFQPRLALEDHEVAISLLQLHLAEVYDEFGLRKKEVRVPVRAFTVIKSSVLTYGSECDGPVPSHNLMKPIHHKEVGATHGVRYEPTGYTNQKLGPEN